MKNQEKISVALPQLAEAIESLVFELTGEKYAFSLCIFNLKANERMNYISNCKREDVVKAWTELLKAWEKGMPDIPSHEIN